MKYIILFISVACGMTAHTQTISSAAVNNNGSKGTAGNIHFEFSLGETFVVTKQHPNMVVTLAFCNLCQPPAPPSL